MKRLAIVAAGICALLGPHTPAESQVERTQSTWCMSNAWIDFPSAHVLVCPQGDGQTLAEADATIHVQAITDLGDPAPGVPPEDIFVYGCDGEWTTLCAPVNLAINADGPTDENGMTTVSGAIRAGGSGTGLWLLVKGWMATGDSTLACLTPICLPITVVSPDMDGNLNVDLVDLAMFAGAYPPQPYSPLADFDGNGEIDVIDLAVFAEHFSHTC